MIEALSTEALARAGLSPDGSTFTCYAIWAPLDEDLATDLQDLYVRVFDGSASQQADPPSWVLDLPPHTKAKLLLQHVNEHPERGLRSARITVTRPA